MLWALLVLPWVIPLILWRHHHHLDVAAVTVLVAVSFGAPTLWITWAAYRGPRRSGAAESGLTLAQVADRLAAAVDGQWKDEVRVRRLSDPWPLPVSWAAADPSLTGAWDSLARLATSGAGWPAPPSEATWASGPGDLAGTDGELVDVLARVPTARLVVLGEPGAGKTMLMVRLVLDLLARRDPGGPVPFLAPVASWAPSRQDLRTWLAARLVFDHPALAAPPPAGVPEPTQAAALLASGLILPVLDGLDEIQDQVRGPAISKINDALRPGEPLVVTCRTQQYRDAVRPQDGCEVTLRAAAAVQLRPLDADDVRDYLSEGAAGPAARDRWAPVLAVLGTEAPAAQALRTPLMAGLARAIYNPPPDKLAGTLRDPAELCDPALPDQAAVESRLFDAFIPALYRHDSGGRWKAQDAEKWLVFLARHLECKIARPDLAWWQLRRSMPRTAAEAVDVVAVVVGIAAGVMVGLGVAAFIVVASARVPVAAAVGLLVAAGVMALVTGGSSAKAPARGVRITGPGGVPVAALSAGYVVLFGGAAALEGGSVVAVVLELALVVGFAAGIMAVAGLEGVPGDLAEAASPRAVLAHDRRMALLFTLAAGPAAGVLVGVMAGSGVGVPAGIAIGVVAGAVVGLGVSARQTAWPSYLLTVGWLAFSHRLPRSLMGFLADAHQRGVLRQAGAVYQFRHIDLQHRLATRPQPELGELSGAGA